MIIAWDGRGLVGPRTGLGWYTHHLIRGFESLDEDWSASLYLNKPVADQFGTRVNQRVFRFPNTVRLRSIWENLYLPLALQRNPPDIWHSPLSVVPKGLKCKAVATIHDLAFLHFPQILPASYWNYWTRRISGALTRTDRLIAVSEATRRDLQHWFDVEDGRITVVYEAADPFYNHPPTPEETASVRSRSMMDGPFFLFVGTVEPRKNLPFLLDVYKQLLGIMKNVPPLLIVGGKGWLQEDLEARIASFGGRVHLLGYLPQCDLRVLYANAQLVLIPSRYEGFGLQAAEAMACGAVVLSSNVSSLPEVVGEGGVLLPIDSTDMWVDKIAELTENEPQLGLLRERAVKQASSFSWQRAARETFGVYQGILGS